MSSANAPASRAPPGRRAWATACAVRYVPAAFAAAFAATAGAWEGHGDLNLKLGTSTRLGRVEIALPLREDAHSLLFADLRGAVTDRGTQEGNVGIAWRRMLAGERAILGVYAFYDRSRTDADNHFNQATVGAEWLAPQWELRVNGYVPENTRKPAAAQVIAQSAGPFVSGNSIYLGGRILLQSYERALRGFDVEAGRAVPGVPGLRVYATAYHFQADDVDDVTGARLRAEYRVNRYLTLGAEVQHDGPRGTDAFLAARLRIPFGAPPPQPGVASLADRMTDPIVRDIDVVSAATRTSELRFEGATPVLGDNGQPQRILFVDNTAAAGDGTAERPYPTLEQAEGASAPYDIIHVATGDGTSRGQDTGIVLKDHQQLIGAGTALVAGGQVILPASQHPVVTSTGVNPDVRFPIQYDDAMAASIATVVLGGHNTVAGLRIENANAVRAVTEFDCIDPVTHAIFPCGAFITRFPGAAVFGVVTGADTLRVADNRIDQSAGPGVAVRLQPGASLTATIEANEFLGRTGGGVESLAFAPTDPFTTTRSALDLTVRANRFTSVQSFAVRLDGGRALDMTLDFDSNRMTGSGAGGRVLSVENAISSTTGTLTARFAGNDISANGGTAIYLWTAPQSELVFESNTITNNGGEGVYVDTRDGTTTARFSGNTITGNGGLGDVVLLPFAHTGARIDATFSGDTIGTRVGP
ncbi:MAG: inverse autotransporter beta domain-containing protein [Gammaproteobacteria bacterium]